MSIYATNAGIEIEYNTLNDRMFYAIQAMLSQRLLECEDRAEMYGGADETDRYDCRLIAVEEWSAAVRHGFVCC